MQRETNYYPQDITQAIFYLNLYVTKYVWYVYYVYVIVRSYRYWEIMHLRIVVISKTNGNIDYTW